MQKISNRYGLSVLFIFMLIMISSCQSRLPQPSAIIDQESAEKKTATQEVQSMTTDSLKNTQTATNDIDNATGSVTGMLSYPSEGIPPLRVVFFNTEKDSWFSKDFPANTTNYQMDGLIPGKYTVVAYLADNSIPGLSAGFSQAVPCGLSVDCVDHSLIVIEVTADHIATDVNPVDWYAPDGTFPIDPTK